MTISNLLQLGRGALSSHQNRMETINNNMANASTPGYRRQRVDLVTLGGELQNSSIRGVTSHDPTSIRAPFLNRQIPHQRAEFGYHSTRVGIESAVEAILIPGDGSGLSNKVDSFFASASSMASNPGDMTLRRDFVAKADELSRTFRETASALDREQTAIREHAADVVSQTNANLQRIAELDQQIKQSPVEAGELIDQRDRLIASVSENLAVDVVRNDDATVQIVTREGKALVEGGIARELELSNAAGQLTVNVLGAAGGPQQLTRIGGSIGAMVHSHETVIGGERNRLDQLAFDFTEAANLAHQAGFGLDGNTGRDLFSPPPGVNGAAATMQVDSAILADPSLVAASDSAANNPGGNANLLAMIQLQDQQLSGGETLRGGLMTMTQTIATGIQQSTASAESSSAALAQLESLEASVEGVSLEEEMLAMMETQKSFEAALKVIQTTDEMMQTILSIKQ